MLMKLFRIRLNDESESDQKLLNAFLEKFEIKNSFTQLVTGHPPYWSVLLYFDEDSEHEKAWLKSVVAQHYRTDSLPEADPEGKPEGKPGKPAIKKKKINSSEVIENLPDGTVDPENRTGEKALLRLEKLKTWRAETCKRMNLPPYIVASNATLEEIANVNPPDIKSLMDIKGMGQQKILKYGSDIISILQSDESITA